MPAESEVEEGDEEDEWNEEDEEDEEDEEGRRRMIGRRRKAVQYSQRFENWSSERDKGSFH